MKEFSLDRRWLFCLIVALFGIHSLAACSTLAYTVGELTNRSPIDGKKLRHSKQEIFERRFKFKAHVFGALCFSTYNCRVVYNGVVYRDDPEDELSPSTTYWGTDYPDILDARGRQVTNFPPPAIIDWRSADGARLQAEIDIGEIFKDERVRHNVSKEDAAIHFPVPRVILEVNDRTINVYMRGDPRTRSLYKPGNQQDDVRSDLIEVFSNTY